ncbi:hypothetical protein BU15DRAFT_67517 [Melanogaster broomeanus]|nr:hypothetical protein BU15DRAFT_67517 [Melanogaster broomeanus]
MPLPLDSQSPSTTQHVASPALGLPMHFDLQPPPTVPFTMPPKSVLSIGKMHLGRIFYDLINILFLSTGFLGRGMVCYLAQLKGAFCVIKDHQIQGDAMHKVNMMKQAHRGPTTIMSDLVPATSTPKHKCLPSEACTIHLSDIGRRFHTFPKAHPLYWQWTTKSGPNAGKTFKVPTVPTHCPKGFPKAISWLVNTFHSFKAHLAQSALHDGRVPKSLLQIYLLCVRLLPNAMSNK